MNRRLAPGAVAVAIAGVAFFPTVASAAVCGPGESPQGTYPSCTSGISDSSAFPGELETVSIPSGAFTPGETVEYGVRSVYQRLGTTTAAADGSASATFAVPMDLAMGSHEVVFTGLSSGMVKTVDFTVSPGPGSSSGSSGSSGSTGVGGFDGSSGFLPRTGADGLIPMTVASIGLVLVGGGAVVVARRRREDAPSTVGGR